MKNIKVHAIVLALIIIAEMIGNVSFKIGVGTIVLLPMLYALIMGIFMAPKFLKVVNQKDMLDASSLIGITLMLLMARYGTLVGPTLPKILAASPALILQELVIWALFSSVCLWLFIWASNVKLSVRLTPLPVNLT